MGSSQLTCSTSNKFYYSKLSFLLSPRDHKKAVSCHFLPTWNAFSSYMDERVLKETEDKMVCNSVCC